MVTADTGTTVAGEVTLRATSRRLVGREGVISDLHARYRRVRDRGSVETLLLEGPAGIGKSRIVTSFAEQVDESGGRLLLGHCVHLGEVVLPYAPLVEMVAGLVRDLGPDVVRSWAGPPAAELARLLPVLSDPSGPGPEQATGANSTRLFQALRGVLDAAAGERPLLVVVEDIHWADRSTLDMLSILVPQLRGPVLLVVTQRTDERPVEPRVGRFRTQLAGHGDQRLTLPALTREEQAQQLSDILGVPPTTTLLDRVYARAEGNPFFAEELLALGEVPSVPAGVRELLLARLESLPPQSRQVLRAASVIGRRAPYRLLEAVVGLSTERLDGALRVAVEEHLLVPDSEGGVGFSFRHALLQEAVADSLLPGESARLHRRVAETLTASPGIAGSRGSVIGSLARHWYAAEALEEALKASVEAAAVAKRSLAFSESLAHYERALELLVRVPDAEDLLEMPRHWLLWSAAEVAHLAAEPLRAAELVRAAIAEVPSDAPHHHAYLHERLGRYLWMCGDGQGALAAYQQAVELVPDEPTRWRAAALSGYSQILMLASRWEESEAYAREAIDVAVTCGARSLEGHARCNLGVDVAKLGRLDEGVSQLFQALAIAEEEFDDVDDIARARVNLHTVLMQAGRFEDAATLGQESLDVVERLGLLRRKGVWCRCDLTGTYLVLGRHSAARELLDEAETLDPAGIDRINVDLLTGILDCRTGRHDDARRQLQEIIVEHADRLLDPQLLGPLYENLVEVTTWLGDPDAARAAAREGLARIGPVVDTFHVLPLMLAAARALCEHAQAQRGSRPLPRELLEEAAGLEEQAVALVEASREVTPVVANYLDEVRAELGRLRQVAEGDWAGIAERWQELGLPYRAAYALMRAAEDGLRRRRRATARDHLVGCRELARVMDARHLEERAEQMARRARIALTDDATSPGVPHGLTPRELEVLELIAQGLTDREVAERLFISHRTVERHVSHLLAKLDASRRAELVTLAHRQGLLPH